MRPCRRWVRPPDGHEASETRAGTESSVDDPCSAGRVDRGRQCCRQRRSTACLGTCEEAACRHVVTMYLCIYLCTYLCNYVVTYCMYVLYVCAHSSHLVHPHPPILCNYTPACAGIINIDISHLRSLGFSRNGHFSAGRALLTPRTRAEERRRKKRKKKDSASDDSKCDGPDHVTVSLLRALPTLTSRTELPAAQPGLRMHSHWRASTYGLLTRAAPGQPNSRERNTHCTLPPALEQSIYIRT